MQYAVLGRTGLKVSRLGFGAMRLPMAGEKVDRDKAVPMIHRAFEAGVNYIDTAVGYCNHDSQCAVGDALKGWRDKIVVSTKNPYYDKTNDRPWWKNLEDSLRRLDVETIDIYNHHGLNWRAFEEQVRGPDGIYRWMQKAKDQGLIRHICFSFHDTAKSLVKLARTGQFDVVTLQYNLLDRSNEPALATVRKLGMGIVVMGPVGGGRLGSPSEALRKMIPGAKSVPEVALRFVLANPNVTVALSGMSEMKHVEENIRVAGKTTPLSAAEKRRVAATLKRYKKLADLYCTGCNYCMPCPAGVDIPGNFMALNHHRVYGLADAAKQRYGWVRGKATRCLACGKCLDKCPQHIDIIAQLRETVRTLDDAYGKMVLELTPLKVESFARRDGRYSAALRCRLECHNLSDQSVTPRVAFTPAGDIEVEMPREAKELAAFERCLLDLYVRTTAHRDGQPLRLGPSLAGPTEMVFSADPLPVAIAPRAGRKAPDAALRRATLASADHVGGPIVPSSRARSAHALGARFAYDAGALIVQFDARGAFQRPTTPRRPVRRSDNLWLNLHLDDAGAIKSAKDSPKRFVIGFGFPAGNSAEMRVEVHRPRLPAEQVGSIRAEVTGRGPRRRVLVRIPWKLLQVAPPAPGARLGANFGMTCWPSRGRSAWTLSWAPTGRGHLLLVK